MCVNSRLFISFFLFFLREALGPAPPAPNVFHLLNSWPQSDAKTDRNARGNWERGSEKKANVIQRGSNMDLNKRGRRRRRAKSGWSEKDSSADNEGGAASYPKIKNRSVRCLDTEFLNDYTGNSEGTPNNTSSDSNSTPSWQIENNHHEITKKRRLTTHVNITTERKIAPKRLSDQSFRRTPARLIFHRLLWWQAWTCVGVMSITSERGEGGGEGEGLLWVGGKKRFFAISGHRELRRLYSYFTSPAARLSFRDADTTRRRLVKWQRHNGWLSRFCAPQINQELAARWWRG